MLLENRYNNGTFLKPHYEAHNKYTSGFYLDSCGSVTTLLAYQCEFVQSTKSCREVRGHIDYSYIVYCIILQQAGTEQIIFAHILLTFLVIIYTGLAANIAYTKMGPNFIALMRILNFSEHTLGSVIISALYALPSIIKGHSYHLRGEDSVLYITLILGIDLFSKTLAVGVLLIQVYPLQIYPRYLIRDSIVFTILFIVFNDMLYKVDARPPLERGLIITSIWLMYSFLVLIEDYYYLHIYKGVLDPEQKACVVFIRKQEAIHYETANSNLLSQFILKLNPLKMEKFYSNKKWVQILYFLCFPFRIIIDLIIPAVDYNIIHNGWIKLFNCINVITLPMTVLLILEFSIREVLYVTIVTSILSVITFVTSRTDRPPKYHYIFSIFGLGGCIVITNFLVVELLSVLNLAGIMLRLRRGAMTLLLLAPMQTFLLIVLGLSFANCGYPTVSYALFRTRGFLEIAGLGTTFLSAAIINQQEEFHIRPGVFGQAAICFIFIETAATLITAFITKFTLRPTIGWFLIIYFVIIILFVIAIQIDLIHGLGTDHLNELIQEHEWEEDVTWA